MVTAQQAIEIRKVCLKLNFEIAIQYILGLNLGFILHRDYPFMVRFEMPNPKEYEVTSMMVTKMIYDNDFANVSFGINE